MKDPKRKGPSECQKQNKMKIKMEKKISYVKKSQENVAAYNCELEMVITVEKTTLKWQKKKNDIDKKIKIY